MNEYPNRKSYLESLKIGLTNIQRQDINHFSYPIKIQLVEDCLPKGAEPNEALRKIYSDFIKEFNTSLDIAYSVQTSEIQRELNSEEEEFREYIKDRSTSDKVPSESSILAKCFV